MFSGGGVMFRVSSFVLMLVIGFATGSAGRLRAQEGGGSATKANLDLPFDAGGTAEGDEEAPPEIITFLSGIYEGDFFCFVCDKSGSMVGEPWRKVQSEVIRTVQGLSEHVQFAIVFFDQDLVKFPSAGRPADATAATKGQAARMVMSTGTGHGSCYKEALAQALRYAEQSTAKRKQIIVLGDGHTTCRGQDEAKYGKETLIETASRNRFAHINTLGIGQDVQEDWLKALAAQNRGTYRRVPLP